MKKKTLMDVLEVFSAVEESHARWLAIPMPNEGRFFEDMASGEDLEPIGRPYKGQFVRAVDTLSLIHI